MELIYVLDIFKPTVTTAEPLLMMKVSEMQKTDPGKMGITMKCSLACFFLSYSVVSMITFVINI